MPCPASNWLNWDLNPRGLIPEPTLSYLCAFVSSCLLEVLSYPLGPLIPQSVQGGRACSCPHLEGRILSGLLIRPGSRSSSEAES